MVTRTLGWPSAGKSPRAPSTFWTKRELRRALPPRPPPVHRNSRFVQKVLGARGGFLYTSHQHAGYGDQDPGVALSWKIPTRAKYFLDETRITARTTAQAPPVHRNSRFVQKVLGVRGGFPYTSHQHAGYGDQDPGVALSWKLSGDARTVLDETRAPHRCAGGGTGVSAHRNSRFSTTETVSPTS